MDDDEQKPDDEQETPDEIEEEHEITKDHVRSCRRCTVFLANHLLSPPELATIEAAAERAALAEAQKNGLQVGNWVSRLGAVLAFPLESIDPNGMAKVRLDLPDGPDQILTGYAELPVSELYNVDSYGAHAQRLIYQQLESSGLLDIAINQYEEYQASLSDDGDDGDDDDTGGSGSSGGNGQSGLDIN